MYIVVSAAKKRVKAEGKQLSKEALFELNCRVENILKSACELAKGFKRITTTEITHGRG